MKNVMLFLALSLAGVVAQAELMLTPWGEKVTSENCWRDYPRPQMARAGWQCLNGDWDYAITSVTNTPGRPEKWDGKIRVPFALEAPLSGVKGRLLQPQEYLWYTRGLELDPKPGEKILLHFGAVDFRAIVYLGHDEVAATPHEGGQLPFTVDLTPYAKKGANTLTVLVWDPTEDFIQSRGKQAFRTHACFYTRMSGISQTVWLETVPERHIVDYTVVTDIEVGTVTFNVAVDGLKYGDTETGTIAVTEGGREIAAGTFKPGEACTLKMPAGFGRWSPESPRLYDFTAKFGSDAVNGYFAMRTFEKRRDAKGVWRFYLNNEPYYVMGTLDQGWWPDGLLTPPSDEAMAFDIQTLKDCGFNTMRKHIKVEPLRYYYLCDKLGLLVLQDMPCNSVDARGPFDWQTAKGYGLYREELKGMMDLLQKVPSIVMWVPYNEGWGQHDQNLTHTTLDFVKKHDPTRLVNGPSGWADFEGGEIYNDKGQAPRRTRTAHRPAGECEAADAVDYHYYRGPKMPPLNDRRVSFLGEFGGLGHPVEGHIWRTFDQAASLGGEKSGDWGYGGIEDTKTREGLEKTYLGLMEELGKLAGWGLAGSIYTQTTDVEIEINGLLTYDRKVLKYNPAVLKQAHAAVAAKAKASALNAPGNGTDLLYISHVHRGGGKLERPDNTLETFEWCWENGSALECDCRKTKDGVGIMLHDNTLARTVRGIPEEMKSKSVSNDLAWAEIKDVDAGSYLDKAFAHHRIPTIEETFAAMKGHPTYLCFVDEKGAGPEYIARKAIEAGVQDQVYYTGPSHEKIFEWNKIMPGGKSLLWLGAWPKGRSAQERERTDTWFRIAMEKLRAKEFKYISAVSIHTYYDPKDPADPFIPSTPLLKEMVNEFHSHGIPVASIPFAGGETEEVYFKLYELGFDAFSTDYPSVMFSVIRKLKAGVRE